jgi:hypothetical protein
MLGKAFAAAKHGNDSLFILWLGRIASSDDNAAQREMAVHLDRAYSDLDKREREQVALLAADRGPWRELSAAEKCRVAAAPVSGNPLFRTAQRQIQARAPSGP